MNQALTNSFQFNSIDYIPENNNEASHNDGKEELIVFEAPQESAAQTLTSITEKKSRRWKSVSRTR